MKNNTPSKEQIYLKVSHLNETLSAVCDHADHDGYHFVQLCTLLLFPL